ncbi:MAG TPA: class I SAM-dependent methyltransferase [Paucimonas sp.]|nr:class I SAM-dependent methyltransferase [Paucimonas sp.]
MSDWSAGYVADIGYTFGYYPELNPLRVKLAFLNAGLVYPDMGNACELGYGQGLSANLHAAASVTSWYGNDFNPAQAGFAQELAEASGSGAKLTDEAFADFANRTDLPDFDYIGLHGIWSWVSDENRTVIIDFIRRKLKVGGVLYVSYNTLPGLSAFSPVRHLMTHHAKIMGAEGLGIVSRVDGAMAFVEKLFAVNPGYVRANPQILEHIKKIKGRDRHYLAHEYFNRDWHPMHFSTMADWLSPCKLTYACSANYLDHIDILNLTPEQQSFLKEIPDAVFRETVRDFMTNQQFRRDYWVKGARKLNAIERSEKLRALRVILSADRRDVSLKVSGALGEATMNADVYNPILDILADNQPKTLAEIEQEARGKGNVTLVQVLEVIMVLAGAGHVKPVQDQAVMDRAKVHADKLNLYLMNKARGSNDVGFLASPATGGGFTAGRTMQLFLLAIVQGKKQPEEWAKFAAHLLAAQGQKIIKDGKTLQTPEENLAELMEQAKVFSEKQLQILKALQIV